jgi:hypothetical protein
MIMDSFGRYVVETIHDHEEISAKAGMMPLRGIWRWGKWDAGFEAVRV